jgi:hypothetical protein
MLIYILAVVALVLAYCLYVIWQPLPSSQEASQAVSQVASQVADQPKKKESDIVHHILDQMKDAKSEEEKNNLSMQLKIILDTMVATTSELAELKLKYS